MSNCFGALMQGGTENAACQKRAARNWEMHMAWEYPQIDILQRRVTVVAGGGVSGSAVWLRGVLRLCFSQTWKCTPGTTGS